MEDYDGSWRSTSFGVWKVGGAEAGVFVLSGVWLPCSCVASLASGATGSGSEGLPGFGLDPSTTASAGTSKPALEARQAVVFGRTRLHKCDFLWRNGTAF